MTQSLTLGTTVGSSDAIAVPMPGGPDSTLHLTDSAPTGRPGTEMVGFGGD